MVCGRLGGFMEFDDAWRSLSASVWGNEFSACVGK